MTAARIRALRDRCRRELDNAIDRHVTQPARLAAERSISEDLARHAHAERNAAWFHEQRAKLQAERDLSDPRKLLVRRLQVAAHEPAFSARLDIAGAALTQYIDDSEITRLWKALA